MAQESSSSFFGSFTPQQLLAVLTLLSSTVLLQLQPLQSWREVEIAGKASAAGDDHKFLASHVEDPLAALKEQNVAEPDDSRFDPATQVQAYTHYGFFSQELRDSVEKARKQKRKVQLVCALLRPGNDLLSCEQRHRARLAVFSALATLGYAPEAVRRMQVCRLRDIVNDDLRSFTHPWRLGPGTVDVPFEWFTPTTSLPEVAERRFDRIGVLWFDTEAVMGREAESQPLDRLRRILHALVTGLPSPMDGGLVSVRFDPGLVETTILGPPDSSTLALMLRETSAKRSSEQRWDEPLRMASPYATSSALALFRQAGLAAASAKTTSAKEACLASERELQQQMDRLLDKSAPQTPQSGLFLRTPLTDDHVAEALVHELKRRGVILEDAKSPCQRDPAAAGDIVLISESDTAYGRELARDFLEKAGAKGGEKALRPAPNGRWHWTSYARGLDGRFGAAPSPAFAKVKAKGRDDEKEKLNEGNEPHGTNQMDALRRLARQLLELHEERQREGKPGIVAVGVLGSDVFDKLLVFRALKPLLKDTLFFTNNLDAWLWNDAELRTTRNLIVASPFDLRLGDHWQAGKPPFRDSYQTSVYAATLALAGGDKVPHLRAQLGLGPHAGEHEKAVRLFEIGREGPVSLPLPKEGGKAGARALHPVHEVERPFATKRSLLALGGLMILMAGSFVLWKLASTHRLGRLLGKKQGTPAPQGATQDTPPQGNVRGGGSSSAGRSLRLASHPATIVAAVAAGWLLSCLLWQPMEEPPSLINGTSSWFFFTTSVIAVFIAAVLGWRALAILRQGELRLRSTYFPNVQEDRDRQWFKLHSWKGSFVRDVLLLWPDKVINDPQKTLNPANLWKGFHHSGWPGPRLARALFVSALIGAGIWLLSLPEPPPFLPVRGEAARLLCRAAQGLSVAAFVGLSMVIFDSLWLNRIFIDWFAEGPTNWPKERRKLNDEKDLTDRQRCDYTDLLLIADWTRDIGRLTALPFYVLAMLVLARLAWFDMWRWPWSLCAGLAVTAALVILGSYRVHLAALRLKNDALVRLAPGDAVLDDPAADAVKKLREKVQQLSHGAFAPFLKQPVMEAVFWFVSTLGATGLFQAISQMMA